MESTGTSSPLLPPVWKEETNRPVNLIFMYSCAVFPALRQTRVASGMWLPSAQANKSLGLALLTRMVKLKSFIETLPAPPPPPPECAPVWVSPHDQERISISSLCALS